MKRGGSLKRVPMPPRKALINSSTPPSDTSGKPVQRKPGKPGKHVGESKAKRLMKKRCDGLCEPRIPRAGCLYYVSDLHHRLLHGQGGEWEIRNALGVCRPCHMALTDTAGHREEYEHYGWIVPSHGNPATTEAFIWHDGRQDWFLLKGDGTAELAPFPEGRPEHPDDLDLPGESRDLGGVA